MSPTAATAGTLSSRREVSAEILQEVTGEDFSVAEEGSGRDRGFLPFFLGITGVQVFGPECKCLWGLKGPKAGSERVLYAL